MGSIFKPKTTVVSVPSSSQASTSGEVKPYAPVEPYILDLLPRLESTFAEDPALYTGSYVPSESAQTLAARDIYTQAGAQAAAFAPAFQQVFDQQLAQATAAPGTSALYQAQTGAIADEARRLTERDKLLAQRQAIEAGQFGLGSTALGELQELQRRQREETIQRQMAEALGAEEVRRRQAQAALSGTAQQVLRSQLTPGTLQEQVGRDIEAREAARLSDQARLAQQQQEAERAQAITYANLLGGLAGLGSTTQMQQTASGTTGQAFAGPSIFQQYGNVAANIVKPGG